MYRLDSVGSKPGPLGNTCWGREVHTQQNDGSWGGMALSPLLSLSVTDITTASRGGASAYRGVKLAWRIFRQRKWLSYLRLQAVLRALMTAEGPVPAAVNEAALTICAILDTTEVPMEVARGRMVRMRRWLRERITHGVRYPRFDSVFRDTYWDRLRLWGEAAARHPGGVKALNHAGFLPGYSDTDRARKFADRLVAYTQRLLLDHGLPEQQNRVRDEMASEVFRGLPRSELSNRERYRQITVRSLTYGIGSSLFTLLAFGQDLDNSAILGGVAATSAAITDISHGGLGRLSGPMLGASAGKGLVGFNFAALAPGARHLGRRCNTS